ncbi:hypothetical protein SDC9_140790 [bioreactor metagenome]|uniref:PAS domain-containing protein n=1 Tax=bioreactor metagenome TaxID=1076179 RepID=A0A645DVW5_9ZZZZ
MADKDGNELEQLKRELAEERQEISVLKAVLDMAYEGIVIVDKNGKIKMISKPYADFLGGRPKSDRRARHGGD